MTITCRGWWGCDARHWPTHTSSVFQGLRVESSLCWATRKLITIRTFGFISTRSCRTRNTHQPSSANRWSSITPSQSRSVCHVIRQETSKYNVWQKKLSVNCITNEDKCLRDDQQPPWMLPDVYFSRESRGCVHPSVRPSVWNTFFRPWVKSKHCVSNWMIPGPGRSVVERDCRNRKKRTRRDERKVDSRNEVYLLIKWNEISLI